jgi:DNA-binding MarR family transcriptional regulator
MAPNKADVRSMVVALFTVNAGLERARRKRKGASTLSLLQVIANGEPVRPSEIADLQVVHPSLITHRVRELEDAGYVEVNPNPKDARSFLVQITSSGADELDRLTRLGLDRFAQFVASWKPGEVRMLERLLIKLHADMAAVYERERSTIGVRSRLRTRVRIGHSDGDR